VAVAACLPRKWFRFIEIVLVLQRTISMIRSPSLKMAHPTFLKVPFSRGRHFNRFATTCLLAEWAAPKKIKAFETLELANRVENYL